MEWASNLPFSIKNDFWINTSNYRNMKDLKVEATFAVAFAIAEGYHQTAEDIAFGWIDSDHFFNKLGKAHIVESLLTEYRKFADQTIIMKLQK